MIDRIRDFEADGQRALAEVVAPALMRPFPAATIVEVTSPTVQRVPAEAEVTTRGETPYRFRLLHDVETGPYRVQNARIVRTAAGEESLQFDVVSTSEAPLEHAMSDTLRIYVDAPRESASLVTAHVLGHTQRAELLAQGQRARTLQLLPDYGTRAEDALAPEPDGPLTGAEFLREYFLLPEKFAFLELKGLFRALLGTPARQATVALRFDAPLPARVSLTGDALRAHCVPAVNLFRTTSEPRIFGPGASNFAVRVAGLSPKNSAVYAIVGARATPVSSAAGSSPSIPMAPVRRFGAGELSASFPYAYSLRFARSGGQTVPMLSLTSPRGTEPLLTPHIISLDLLATNGDCPVRPGELSEPGRNVPNGVRVRNVVPASPFVPASVGTELALHAFVRSAAPGGDPFFALKSLLFSLVPQNGLDPALVAAQRARIHGLESLAMETAIDKGKARRGYRASFSIDEAPFRGLGDVALFVRLLHRTLDAQTSVNRFYRCEARCKKSGVRFVWPKEIA